MSRRDSREAAVKIIFQNEFIDGRLRSGGDAEAELSVEDMIAMFIESVDEKEMAKVDRTFVAKVLGAVLDNIETIDELICDNIDSGWNINRLCKVDLAILREAIAEIRYIDDIPVCVSINEAVELSKKFSYPEASSFVNGILGSVSKND